MAPISPWFFTVSCIRRIVSRILLIAFVLLQHYSPSSWNKNWIYRGDDWLYPSRWEMLYQHRDMIDLVEIITWNGAWWSYLP